MSNLVCVGGACWLVDFTRRWSGGNPAFPLKKSSNVSTYRSSCQCYSVFPEEGPAIFLLGQGFLSKLVWIFPFSPQQLQQSHQKTQLTEWHPHLSHLNTKHCAPTHSGWHWTWTGWRTRQLPDQLAPAKSQCQDTQLFFFSCWNTLPGGDVIGATVGSPGGPPSSSVGAMLPSSASLPGTLHRTWGTSFPWLCWDLWLKRVILQGMSSPFRMTPLPRTHCWAQATRGGGSHRSGRWECLRLWVFPGVGAMWELEPVFSLLRSLCGACMTLWHSRRERRPTQTMLEFSSQNKAPLVTHSHFNGLAGTQWLGLSFRSTRITTHTSQGGDAHLNGSHSAGRRGWCRY